MCLSVFNLSISHQVLVFSANVIEKRQHHRLNAIRGLCSVIFKSHSAFTVE